jgi:SAM-dependent methyltransferase
MCAHPASGRTLLLEAFRTFARPSGLPAHMPSHDPYLSLPLTADTQDLYLVRTSIRQALRSQLTHFHGTFLDIGCGVQPYRGLITSAPARVERYIGMDLAANAVGTYRAVPPDVEWNGTQMPLADASVDSAMATEVLEHCPDPAAVLSEAFRVLKPGGFLFFTVPFLWPLHDVPYDEYRYTPFALERIVKSVGFGTVVVKPLGGWDASLAQMLGLWATRRPMPNWKRSVIKRITLPVVKYLINHDHVPDPKSSPMITGLMGTAVKPIR